MNTIVEKAGHMIVEAVPTLFVIAVVSYIVFGGPLADFMQLFATWLYG